jgi:type IV pilus assembly protein PilW
MKKQAGFSLIELLIAMTVGLVVLGVIGVSFLTGLAGSKVSQAQAQMSEDAQVALTIMRRQIQQAAFISETVPGIDNSLGRAGFAFFACDAGFSNATGGTAAVNMALLSCNVDANPSGASASFAVAYEADASNTEPTAAGLATDCVGDGIGATAGMVENRYSLRNGTLFCAGSGGATPFSNEQPFVNNIESIQYEFSLATTGSPTQVRGVITTTLEIGPADAAGASAPTNADLAAVVGANLILKNASNPADVVTAPITANAVRWRLLRSVRVCVVVASESPVSKDVAGGAANPTYLNCRGVLTQSTDGRMRKAYSTSVVLRNLRG